MSKATPDRSSGTLTVKCPQCDRINSFCGFDSVDIFICAGCGDPVEVEEVTQ